MIERITCEGFIENESGNSDGTMNLVMVKPIFRIGHPRTAAGIDEFVEDLWIDLTCKQKLEALSDNELNNSTTMIAFKQAQAAFAGESDEHGMVYWKRTFEWNPDDDNHFEIVERAGT